MLIILALLAIAFGAVILISVAYQTASCVDGVQNQGETGIDCGGPCPYLCTDQQLAPTVLFTQTVDNGSGRVDLVASVENKNVTAAARTVPYRVRVYGANQALLREMAGSIDLPPATVVPVYIPGVAASQQSVKNAFLEIDPTAPKWFTLSPDPRIVPKVSGIRLGGTMNAPRIQATLSNPSATALSNVQAVVMVYNPQGTIIGASSTVIPVIPGQDSATMMYTWNGPFVGAPTRIEVVPIIPLPVSAGS